MKNKNLYFTPQIARKLLFLRVVTERKNMQSISKEINYVKQKNMYIVPPTAIIDLPWTEFIFTKYFRKTPPKFNNSK